MRVCELCCAWFQKALERYFDVMELSKTPKEQEISIVTRRSSITIGERSPVLTPSSPLIVSETNDEDEEPPKLRRRQSRHSISVVAPQKSVSKPWFSGHLRAMHVGDRLPRKKTKTDGDLVSADDESGDQDTRRRQVTRSFNSSHVASPSLEGEQLQNGSEEKGCDGINDKEGEKAVAGSEKHQDGVSLEAEKTGEVDIFQMEPVLASVVKPVLTQDSVEVKESKDDGNSLERRHRCKTSKKSKFSRSASFDFTNLNSISPSSSTTSLVAAGNDDASDTSSSRSGKVTEKTGLPRPKCFDDSDIVDSRARADASDNSQKNNADLPATVLRFAVYKTGGNDSQSLRRTLGFGKANPVLDRYSLELDCSQGIVRVKSVFMHRFWSFHCDAVQHLTVGSSSRTARLVVHSGVQGNQTHELQFANEEERDEFKRAVENCRSTSLHAMRQASIGASAPSSPQFDPSVLQESSSLDDAASLTDAFVHGEISSINVTTESAGADTGYKFQLFSGEAVVKGTEFPSTLLIGPVGDNNEVSHTWGRIRGLIVVTNFRVLFVPSEQCYVPFRTALQGAAPYIPLFAITYVQILYPGGRRSKSSRTYSTGLPSIVVLNCKDIRVMRVQLEGPPHVSDERSQLLLSVISKMADESQRIKTVERGSPDAMLLTNSSPPTHLSLGITINGSGIRDDATEMSGSTEGKDDVASTRNFIGPATAPSPVLRPGSPLETTTLELSGSFAFSYSLECASPDVNGWNLFADEREFKRQIGGDPTVQPFFKVSELAYCCTGAVVIIHRLTCLCLLQFYQNARGNICKTYPSKILLPASMTSATLTKVTEFRSKNRLPVITYYHRRNRCVLTRSSQPLLGNLLSGSSSVSDQLLVGVYRRLPDIIRNQSISSASSRPIYIFDARKLKASTGNRLMGKGGVETPQDYPGAVVHHLNIANMYRMQSSFVSLVKLLLPGAIDDNDKNWLLRVESTRWLNHLRLVLDGAMKIARVLELEGSSVLVHCSDGWDRTSQLTALAQIMIDPYYRTIRGFAVLVEKDWCAFGHKFAERLGGDRNKDPQRNKSSPVMLQFLDAVWQIQRQFPYAFEFNERFLLHVANSLTSGLYGTFLYDSRLQRDVNNVRENSVSVWTHVLMNPGFFTNPEYVQWEKPIWPWTGIQIMHIWEGYFLQWHPKYYNCHWISTLANNNATPEQQQCMPAASALQKIQFEPVPAPPPPRNGEGQHQHQETDASSTVNDRDRESATDSGGFTGAVTNLGSPIQEAPPSNPSSVRSSSSRRSSARPQPVQVPKLGTRNGFIYRS